MGDGHQIGDHLATILSHDIDVNGRKIEETILATLGGNTIYSESKECNNTTGKRH